MREVKITLPLTIKIIYEKEASSSPFVAYSPELDISSCGASETEAQDNLYEAIELLLIGAVEDGVLEELLQEAGFTLSPEKVKPPKIFFSPHTFDLPVRSTVTRFYAQDHPPELPQAG